MSSRPFARVYYVDLERDYPEIWHDAATLGAYVQLLAVAEAMWPARPEVPRSIRPGAVRTLTDAGLLVALPRLRYCIKGMDAERTARSTAASIAARTRHGNAERTADAVPTHATSRAEPSPAESPLPLTEGRRKDGTNPRALGTNPRTNGQAPRQKRDALKKGGVETLGAILARANAEGRS